MNGTRACEIKYSETSFQRSEKKLLEEKRRLNVENSKILVFRD